MPGVDFHETHAPVVSSSSLRALLSIAAILDWEIHSVDVDLAFLNSDIDQPIYCKQPPGFAVEGTSCLASTQSSLWAQASWIFVVHETQVNSCFNWFHCVSF